MLRTLRALFRRSSPRRPRPRRRLVLEELESRLTPSNFNVLLSEAFEASAVAGQSTTFNALANFQGVADPTGFKATIHWGDEPAGSPADGVPGTITRDPRDPQFLFDINGTHAYPAGISTTYLAYVQLTSPDGTQTFGGPEGPLTYVTVNAPAPPSVPRPPSGGPSPLEGPTLPPLLPPLLPLPHLGGHHRRGRAAPHPRNSPVAATACLALHEAIQPGGTAEHPFPYFVRFGQEYALIPPSFGLSNHLLVARLFRTQSGAFPSFIKGGRQYDIIPPAPGSHGRPQVVPAFGVHIPNAQETPPTEGAEPDTTSDLILIEPAVGLGRGLLRCLGAEAFEGTGLRAGVAVAEGIGAAGTSLELRAQQFLIGQGESIIPSKVIRGAKGFSNNGFDLASYSGFGANARLFITEVKNVTGRVPTGEFSALGLGKSGLRTYQRNLAEIEKHITDTVADPLTRDTLLAQLRNNQAVLRFIGSTQRGTVFDPAIIQRIEQLTGLRAEPPILLP